jgi:hypothetical protein
MFEMEHSSNRGSRHPAALARYGGELVDWIVTFTAAAYNLVRLRTLLARPA